MLADLFAILVTLWKTITQWLTLWPSRRQPEPLLERLPKEIIPQILLCLDSQSLLSLLIASPYVASLCVVITQSSYHEPSFFICPPTVRTFTALTFDPLKHPALFKIYELGIPSDANLEELPIEKFIPFATRWDSFALCYLIPLFLQSPSISQVECFRSKLTSSAIAFQFETFQGRRLFLSNSKELPFCNENHLPTELVATEPTLIHNGKNWGKIVQYQSYKTACPRLEQPCIEGNGWIKLTSLLVKPRYRWNGIPAESLVHINIHNCTELENVRFPRALTRLSITFINSQRADKRPRMSNVVWGTGLFYLGIYYEDLPPVFSGFDNCQPTMADEIHPQTLPGGPPYPNFQRVLHVCHLPSQRGDITTPLPIPSGEPEDIDFSPLSWLFNSCALYSFDTLIVTGGHDCIVSQLLQQSSDCHSFCYWEVRLSWRQTCHQKQTLLHVEGPALHGVRFETVLPSTVLPTFKNTIFTMGEVLIFSHSR